MKKIAFGFACVLTGCGVPPHTTPPRCEHHVDENEHSLTETLSNADNPRAVTSAREADGWRLDGISAHNHCAVLRFSRASESRAASEPPAATEPPAASGSPAASPAVSQ